MMSNVVPRFFGSQCIYTAEARSWATALARIHLQISYQACTCLNAVCNYLNVIFLTNLETGVRRIVLKHSESLRDWKNFDKRPNRRLKFLRRSQDRGKAVDNVFSVVKAVQFLLYGKNASSVSREYVRHAWMSTGDDFVRRPAAPRH